MFACMPTCVKSEIEPSRVYRIGDEKRILCLSSSGPHRLLIFSKQLLATRNQSWLAWVIGARLQKQMGDRNKRKKWYLFARKTNWTSVQWWLNLVLFQGNPEPGTQTPRLRRVFFCM
ncbi:hypothetical protein L6452_20718 [Arctium lappa]|uniref:Uncharacterized protein n=1 Tax=Arctium lappa TaxID=4217 RepID=A0ACB9BCZ1_ARCLA|nr:hypothetical protein L6452_20718 [Arctium lappa]